jgi:glycosyltransferase involved in cell wall biosynthesis
VKKISVCMAVHNGELFLQQQIDSILPQLKQGDELIIADDASTDATPDIINSYLDSRIHRLPAQKFGDPSKNFEYALSYCNNEIIFIADQDDVWHDDKIEIMTTELALCDLVVCDCRLIDENGKVLSESFFEQNHSQEGLVKNLIKNSFVGCCMAFRNNLLEKVLPFPADISMYDQWIGLIAQRYFKVKFITQTLVDHRRHNRNYSSTGKRSKNSWNKKVISRLQLAKALWQH